MDAYKIKSAKLLNLYFKNSYYKKPINIMKNYFESFDSVFIILNIL